MIPTPAERLDALLAVLDAALEHTGPATARLLRSAADQQQVALRQHLEATRHLTTVAPPADGIGPA